eukprot:3939483-Rhodomonas_salina.1
MVSSFFSVGRRKGGGGGGGGKKKAEICVAGCDVRAPVGSFVGFVVDNNNNSLGVGKGVVDNGGSTVSSSSSSSSGTVREHVG